MRPQVGGDHRVVVADLRGRSLRDHAPEVEHHDVVADAEHEAHVVIDEQHGHARVGQCAQMAAELGALVGVQSGGGLIHQHEPWALRERAGDADELAPSVRELGREAAADVGQPAQLERPVDGVARVLADRQQEVAQRGQHPHALAGDEQVLLDRQVVEQLDRLERAHEPAPRSHVRAQAGDVVSVERDAAARGRVIAGERVDRRRLAGAVGADQADDLARGHLQVDVVDRGDPAVGDAQGVDVQQCAQALSSARSVHTPSESVQNSIWTQLPPSWPAIADVQDILHTEALTAYTTAMHVLIAGGGLGGLCLAQGLRKAGHSVTVFERDADLSRKVGYRLHMNADGGEALRRCLPDDLFELYLETSRTTPPRQLAVVIDDQLNELSSMPHLGPPNEGPRPHTAVHRQVLRQILLARLGDSVRFGHRVISYEEDACGVRLRLEGGEEVAGDVLVGADGIRSAVRRQRLPHVEVIEAGVEGLGLYGRSRLEGQLPPPLMDGFVIATNKRGGMLAIGAFIPRRPIAEAVAALAPDVRVDPVEDYVMVSGSVPPGTVIPDTPERMHAAMVAAVEGWHPALRGVVERIDPATLFAISFGRLDPTPAWEPSRVTLLGDAIHAMLPTLGQGANMALRDAATLAGKLAGATDAVSAIGA